ncbi:Cys-tRNA(Pro)/Cys-tRNA(Cys) deacylase [Alphaproteobacteria bacterium]|nr:Cys-tRNA(Pro)/Cys-tRNA(Cys) deacylase [Alphaproteobacteria bacterium]
MAKKTPATLLLDKLGIAYEVLEYDYDSSVTAKGLAAAAAVGLPPSQVFKTLMASAGGEVVAAVLPSDAKLDMKALARIVKAKSADMVKPQDAERISGYHVGGVSPLGQKKRLRCFIDQSAEFLPFMLVNGGQRGLQIKISPPDLAKAAGAAFVPIATRD